MNVLKLNEFSSFSGLSGYLINQEVRNKSIVQNFLTHWNLNNNIINIWETCAQQFSEYPAKITTEEILYTISNKKITIILTDGNPDEIKLEEVRHINGSFKPKLIEKNIFSMEILKNYILNANISTDI